MNLPTKIARSLFRSVRAAVQSVVLSYPKRVKCNVCGWEGRRFLSDAWHVHINCPRCRSGVRQRLFMESLLDIERFSIARLFKGKAILHFAPEAALSSIVREHSLRYSTADFLRQDCDFKLDMCNMIEIESGSYDVVIAFDVLEHVPSFQRALDEVHRVLSPRGYGIFTVPQQDGLPTIYEDPAVVTAEGRKQHFGEGDHLRIFGDDFSASVELRGFAVTAIDESSFSDELQSKHVLHPPQPSSHPLATNKRRVFFCQKTT